MSDPLEDLLETMVRDSKPSKPSHKMSYACASCMDRGAIYHVKEDRWYVCTCQPDSIAGKLIPREHEPKKRG